MRERKSDRQKRVENVENTRKEKTLVLVEQAKGRVARPGALSSWMGPLEHGGGRQGGRRKRRQGEGTRKKQWRITEEGEAPGVGLPVWSLMFGSLDLRRQFRARHLCYSSAIQERDERKGPTYERPETSGRV